MGRGGVSVHGNRSHNRKRNRLRKNTEFCCFFGSLKKTPCFWLWASLSCHSPSLVHRGLGSQLWAQELIHDPREELLDPSPTPRTSFPPSGLVSHKSHFIPLESSQLLTPGKWTSPAQTFVWNGLENCITVSDFNLCSVCWRLHDARNTQTKHYSCLQMIPIIFSLNKHCTWHNGRVRNENKFIS